MIKTQLSFVATLLSVALVSATHAFDDPLKQVSSAPSAVRKPDIHSGKSLPGFDALVADQTPATQATVSDRRKARNERRLTLKGIKRGDSRVTEVCDAVSVPAEGLAGGAEPML